MFGMLSLLSLFRCYLMRNSLSPAFCSLPSLCFPLRRFQKPSFLSPDLPSSLFHPRLHHPLILPGAATRSGLPDPDRGNFFLPSTSFLSLIHLIFLPVAASNQTVKVPPPTPHPTPAASQLFSSLPTHRLVHCDVSLPWASLADGQPFKAPQALWDVDILDSLRRNFCFRSASQISAVLPVAQTESGTPQMFVTRRLGCPDWTDWPG